jgi:PAS domain S-box-containing protein
VKALDHARHETSASNALRQKVPIFLRESILFGVLLFGFCAALILGAYQAYSRSKVTDTLNQLRPQAEYLASLVDIRAHAWLVQPDQTDSQPFTALIERLQKMRQFYPDINHLFTGRYQNGDINVILDTVDARRSAKEKHYVARPLNVTLPEDSEERQALEKRQTYVTEKSALQTDGRHLGVIVPLANPSTGVRDFLYVDMDRDDLDVALSKARSYRDLSLLASAVLAAVLAAVHFNTKTRAFYRQALTLASLRENEELFRSTYELSPVAMYLTKTDGQILRANAAFCQFSGYDERMLRELEPHALIAKEDLKNECDQILELESNQASKYQSERRYLRKDGTVAWGLVSIAIVRDSDANISHYLAQVVDISERRVAEGVLRTSEERLALATEAGQVGTWDYDVIKGEFVWNNVMHTIHHSTKAPASRDEYLALVHEEDRMRVSLELQKSLESGAPFHVEYRILAGGIVHHLNTNAVVYRNAKNRSVRMVGTVIDVTEEKEKSTELVRAKEAALAADRAKSEFLAVMSHEIRTPLNGVLGFVSMLKNTPVDSEQLSYIETMESSGQGLLMLVNDILDLSKIESKEIHIEPTTFEVRPFLRRIHQQLQSQAYQKGLHYECAVEYSVPKSIYTDQMRLGQILTNILGNALKFTEHGEVSIVATAKPVGFFQKDWEWRFTIRDSGPGIPQAAIPSLFKLFYQVDSSATRRHGGSGLGLAISQRLAHMLGGDIRVESRLGEGTEFTVVIAAPKGISAPLTNVVPGAKPVEASAPSLGMQGKRILVVEDNLVNRKLCALQLKRLGCLADFAETGLEAVEKVRRFTFDAVLMDMQLPDLDGCGATRKIREEIAGTENLSIIALTANAMPEDRKKCLDAGMNDFLSKPLQYETLAATLMKWV